LLEFQVLPDDLVLHDRIADELAYLIEGDFAESGNHAQDPEFTLLLQAGKLDVDFFLHTGSPEGLLLGLLGCDIAIDDVIQVIRVRVVLGQIRGLDYQRQKRKGRGACHQTGPGIARATLRFARGTKDRRREKKVR
jgi:hypothetical protein